HDSLLRQERKKARSLGGGPRRVRCESGQRLRALERLVAPPPGRTRTAAAASRRGRGVGGGTESHRVTCLIGGHPRSQAFDRQSLAAGPSYQALLGGGAIAQAA